MRWAAGRQSFQRLRHSARAQGRERWADMQGNKMDVRIKIRA